MKIAMSANAANSQECVYCGATGCLTRDHVPPKAIFSKPLPSNLITVPACAKCNNAASNDDEYFRLSLQVRDQMESHQDVIRSRPVLLRSLEKPQKAGMRNALIKNIVLADLVTPSGIFIKKQWAIQTDTDRLRRVVTRIMKGLFFHRNGHRLPDQYEALVFNEESVQKWPVETLNVFQENVIKPILSQPGVTIGNQVFTFRCGFNTTDTDTTYWIFTFYQQASFLGLTQPCEKGSL